jgi:hypothetical protein
MITIDTSTAPLGVDKGAAQYNNPEQAIGLCLGRVEGLTE